MSDLFRLQIAHLHLQWFAAGDEGRTEQPTERKIRKGREEGKVARSADLSSAIVMLFVIVLLGVFAGYFFNTLADMTAYFFANAALIDVRSPVVWSLAARYFLRLVWPILSIGFLAAMLGNVVQVGFFFTLKPIILDFKKIIPSLVKFVRRSLFSVEAVYNFFRLVVKVMVIGIVCYWSIAGNFDRFAGMITMPFMHGFITVAQITFIMLMQVVIVMLALSLVDYGFQKYQHLEQLMMSREEVKEERRTEEGDPLVRGRIRQRMQEFLSRKTAQKVAEADVLVVNPIHYSVALEYNQVTMGAPMVTAKGEDSLALRMRTIAHNNEVPIIENRPLAQGLYRDVDIGEIIPEKYYEAMVVVLKEVYRMKGVQ